MPCAIVCNAPGTVLHELVSPRSDQSETTHQPDLRFKQLPDFWLTVEHIASILQGENFPVEALSVGCITDVTQN